jgi:hypothetical protein
MIKASGDDKRSDQKLEELAIKCCAGIKGCVLEINKWLPVALKGKNRIPCLVTCRQFVESLIKIYCSQNNFHTFGYRNKLNFIYIKYAIQIFIRESNNNLLYKGTEKQQNI